MSAMSAMSAISMRIPLSLRHRRHAACITDRPVTGLGGVIASLGTSLGMSAEWQDLELGASWLPATGGPVDGFAVPSTKQTLHKRTRMIPRLLAVTWSQVVGCS
jgi:hypothetical protein